MVITTGISAAAIGGIIGAIGSAAVMIIKAVHGRNQNKKDQQIHEEKLLEIGASMSGVTTAIHQLEQDLNDNFKKIKDRFDETDAKIEQFRQEQKEVNIVLLRHSITQTYENYKEEKEMPKLLYQSSLNLYDQYHRLGGNSFVTEEIEDMKKWKKGD
jgi:gas vesicle protein